MDTKTCHNKNKVFFFFMIFFCFVDQKLILPERSLTSNFKLDLINLGVVS